jgi:thiol:disulfide interchange protein DsbD
MKDKGKILLLLLIGALAPPLEALAAEEEHPVQARLLADVQAVAPGEAFRLGVEVRMAEAWHTYWAFSGDAGLPTQVEWDLPPGFAAGPLQWPLPEKYEEAGGLVVYGYAEKTLLMAQVQPPSALAEGDTLRLSAAVSWLVCREVCIPGDTTLALSLPVGKALPANQAIFSQYAAQVPGPLNRAVELEYQVRRREGEIQVDLEVKTPAPMRLGEGVPDFYPLEAEAFEFRAERQGAGRLLLHLRPYGPEEVERLKGVLVYGLEGEEGRRTGQVELDLRYQQQGGLLEMEFKAAAEQGSGTMWLYVLLAALGGLILNLMPCVLPVISLKVLGFVGQAGQERGQVRRLGLAFCSGIVAAFLGLALVVLLLKSGGEQLGWGFQFQYPGFVVAMAALIFALGLSLFGVFTVNLPGAGVWGGLAQGEGLGSSFFNGVLATILATPCTAPFLGTALGFAFAQPGGVVWGVFLAIGAGMALPYGLLALQPGWLRFLPRPGAWMERFKQLMGFLLMATVLWLLWVLGKQVGVEGVIWTGAFLLCLGLSCWLVGQWADLRASARQRRLVWIASGAIVGAGYGLFLKPVLKVEPLPEQSPQAEQGLAWQPFSVERVERLIGEGRHVFIDFTAEWCWTCKVNERAVLGNGAVRQRFAELDVALIKADWTNRNPEITRLLRAFGRSGVPLYVIFPAGRPEKALVLPEVITSGLVLEKLDEAAALSRQQGSGAKTARGSQAAADFAERR